MTTEVRRGLRITCGYSYWWEVNSGPLQEQWVLSAAEPSLQPRIASFLLLETLQGLPLDLGPDQSHPIICLPHSNFQPPWLPPKPGLSLAIGKQKQMHPPGGQIRERIFVS